MKNALTLSVLSVLVTVLLSGCGATAKFVYPDDIHNLTRLQATPVYSQTVAVLPFDDSRANSNNSGSIYLFLVPLFPYGYYDNNRPDAARSFVSIDEFNFNPSEDLAKAAAMSLRRSNLFKDAFFTFGGEKSQADYVLSGNIISTEYKGRIFSYGLTFVGPIFWLFGAPEGTSTNKLALNFTLRDKQNNLVWEYTTDKSDYIVQWIYYRKGYDAQMYSKLMEQAMNEAILDLSNKLRNK